ncbi:MAG: zf-HC2 domain-containing protein, partial [Chloroflexi bacterium]|nr:zf-HC2 domain-containing protein [Chloroflexota bacterium]
MNQHVASWLGAYHDGELAGLRLRQVEAHLAQCETCRTELEGLRALAALLQESPAATGLVPPDRFVAQVGLRLPRRPTQPAWQRALETGWRLVPLGLFGAWAFVQAVFAVAGVVMLALRLGVGGEALVGLLPPVEASWLAQVAQLSGASLSDIGG